MRRFKFLSVIIITCSSLLIQSCNKKEIVSTVKHPTGLDIFKSVNSAGIYGNVPDGSYKITLAISSITNPPTNRAIGVTDSATVNGSFEELRDYAPNKGQEWVISNAGSGYYSITNLHSGKALTVPYSHAVAGTPLIQYDYIGANSQLWQIVYQGAYGLYKIVSKLNNSLGVNVANSSTENGASVTLSNLNNNYAYFFLNTINLNVNPGAILSRVTGASPVGELVPNGNQTPLLYNLGGCDLGIMWDMGGGKVGLFFGDSNGADWHATDSGGGNGSYIGPNTLGFSNADLSNGLLTMNSMVSGAGGFAKSVITGRYDIPTAAIRIGSTDYVHYFDILTWSPTLQTNFSRLAQSTDNGQTWTKLSSPNFSSTSKFAFASYAKKDGYVYMIGTPVYRSGFAYLARFTEANILNQSTYEYWNGKDWVVNSEDSATDLFASATIPTSPKVGEASLAYNTKYKRWIFVFTDSNLNQISMRDATVITGPWSSPKLLMNLAGCYGGYIHPLHMDSDDLYFNVSLWWKYNVFLMKTKLKIVQ